MVNYTAGNVRPIMMSDIGTSLVICNIGDERATVLLSDVPNLQRLVYDVTVAATECTVQPDTSTFCARGGHKMPLHGGITVWRAMGERTSSRPLGTQRPM